MVPCVGRDRGTQGRAPQPCCSWVCALLCTAAGEPWWQREPDGTVQTSVATVQAGASRSLSSAASTSHVQRHNAMGDAGRRGRSPASGNSFKWSKLKADAGEGTGGSSQGGSPEHVAGSGAAFWWVGWPEGGSGYQQAWGIKQPLQKGSFLACPLLCLEQPRGELGSAHPHAANVSLGTRCPGLPPALPEEPRQHPCPSRLGAGPSAAQIGKTPLQSTAGMGPAQLSIPPLAVFRLQASESGARTRGGKPEACQGNW